MGSCKLERLYLREKGVMKYGAIFKKTISCERCGKEYQARVTFGAHICDECLARERAKEEKVQGHVDYL